MANKTTCPTEHEEQKAFVRWFRLQYPNTLIFAIPNGGDIDSDLTISIKSSRLNMFTPYVNVVCTEDRVLSRER